MAGGMFMASYRFFHATSEGSCERSQNQMADLKGVDSFII